MREKLIGIYSWVNKINGKIYVGSSIDLTQRIKSHLLGKNSNIHLQNAIKEYGIENFQMSILEFINFKGNNEELKALIIEREQFYLDELCKANVDSNEFYDISYNKNRKADSCLGTKWSDESKENKSKQQSGRVLSEEWRNNIKKNHISKQEGYIHYTKVKGVPESLKNAVKQMHKNNSYSILQYDLKGNFIQEFESCGEASKFFGVDSSNISRAIKNGLKLYKNSYIIKKDKQQEIPLTISLPDLDLINVYDSELKFIGQYENTYHIEKELNINHTVVNRALNKNGWTKNNYFEITKERI